MKVVRFHPEAEAEMIKAAAYYEMQQSDLGRRFLASVQDAVNRIGLNPHLYPIVDLMSDAASLRLFPSACCSEIVQAGSSSWRSCNCPAILTIGNTDRLRTSKSILSPGSPAQADLRRSLIEEDE